ncbi:hypothetical protein ACJX0J_018656 [Zea mays]
MQKMVVSEDLYMMIMILGMLGFDQYRNHQKLMIIHLYQMGFQVSDFYEVHIQTIWLEYFISMLAALKMMGTISSLPNFSTLLRRSPKQILIFLKEGVKKIYREEGSTCSYLHVILSLALIEIQQQNEMKQQIEGLEEIIRKLTHTMKKSVAPSFLDFLYKILLANFQLAHILGTIKAHFSFLEVMHKDKDDDGNIIIMMGMLVDIFAICNLQHLFISEKPFSTGFLWIMN